MGHGRTLVFPAVGVGSQARHANSCPTQSSLKSLALCAGADPNARVADGLTPLHFAALVGSEDVVRVLLVGVVAAADRQSVPLTA